jgi:hypothetical protein
VQHAPHRDKGPQLRPQKIKMLPIETDIRNQISIQSKSDDERSQARTYHTFERIQFQNATANNGKRRTQQQYFRLAVELWAETCQEGSLDTECVKVVHQYSARLVIRGRSPGHYHNEHRESYPGTNTDDSNISHIYYLEVNTKPSSPFQAYCSGLTSRRPILLRLQRRHFQNLG